MSKVDKVEKYVKKGKVDKLTVLAHDTDKEVALAAISGLEKMISNEQSMNTLVGMLENENPEIRKAAVTALGSSSGSYVETQLRYCIGHETNLEVLQAAKDAMARINENIKQNGGKRCLF